MSFIRALSAALAVSLASCSSSPPTGPAPVDLSDPRIGEEVRRVCFASGLTGFQTATPHSVILSRGTQDYLVTTRTRCRDLDHAGSVAVDSRSSCLSRGDRLIAYDSAFGPHTGPAPLPCYVDQIFVWDGAAGNDTVTDPGAPDDPPTD